MSLPPSADAAPGADLPGPEARDFADVDWRNLPAGAVRSFFAAPSGSLAVVSMGDTAHPRVVLAPGVTGSKEDFTLVLPTLVAAGFHVTSYDLAGQYESTHAGPERLVPPRKHYDYDLFVADLLALLEDGPGPVHVLGYSFAATVAQLALAQRPDLFASLALLSCPPRSGQAFRGVSRIGWLSTVLGARAGARLMVWGIRRNFTGVTPARLRFVNERFELTRHRSIIDVMRLMKQTPELAHVLAAAPIPLLVAVGEHDLWPLNLHAEFANRVGARLAVYPAGHSPCETTPDALARDLLALYASAPSR
jgi:pimeloyl-ACP methyl ester carboxylesterase